MLILYQLLAFTVNKVLCLNGIVAAQLFLDKIVICNDQAYTESKEFARNYYFSLVLAISSEDNIANTSSLSNTLFSDYKSLVGKLFYNMGHNFVLNKIDYEIPNNSQLVNGNFNIMVKSDSIANLKDFELNIEVKKQKIHGFAVNFKKIITDRQPLILMDSDWLFTSIINLYNKEVRKNKTEVVNKKIKNNR